MPMNVDGIDFHGDAPDEAYFVMEDGAKLIKGVPGLTCEIGVRRGLGSATIMSSCQHNDDKRVHVGIDPWGNIEYHDHGGYRRIDYTNEMKRETLRDLYNWCSITNQEFLLFIMRDVEFFERFATGIPVHDYTSSVVNEYAYVYFDGPHNNESVQVEIEFFEARAPVGAVFQFDNTDQYDHTLIDKWLVDHGFEFIPLGEGGLCYKQSYQRKSK